MFTLCHWFQCNKTNKQKLDVNQLFIHLFLKFLVLTKNIMQKVYFYLGCRRIIVIREHPYKLMRPSKNYKDNKVNIYTFISFGLLLVFDVVNTHYGFRNHHYRSGTTFKKVRKHFYPSESSPVSIFINVNTKEFSTFININTKEFSYHIFIQYFLALENF